MIKGASGQTIGAQMINITTGAAFAGTVTVYITIDAGVQAIGSVGSGICESEGNGYFTYRPSAAETTGDLIAFTFTGSGALPTTLQVATLSPGQTASISSATSVTSQTVNRLLSAAFRRISVLASGQEMTADMAADGLDTLNDFIASVCQIERLMIYAVTRSTWTLVSGTQDYTVGPGGTINIARPTWINSVGFIDTAVSPLMEYNLGEPLTDEAWAAIPIKAATSTSPVYAYYSPTYPLGTLRLWMVPTSTTLQGVLYAPTPVTQFGALTDVIALPPGYNRFLRDNMALELFPEYRENQQPDRWLVKSATESKANVKRANIRPLDMASALDTGWYDIHSDSVVR